MSNAEWWFSPVAHLSSAFFLSKDPRRTHMAMFTVYLDASGQQHDPDMLTIAGYVSSVAKWKRFDKEWKAALDAEGVTHLHMNDFIPSRGEYVDWKGDKPRRDRFMQTLVKTIKRNVHMGFAWVVNLTEFKEVNCDYEVVEHWGQPYAFAGKNVVALAEKWKKKKHPHEPIRYFFESGDPGRHELEQSLIQGGIDPHFEPKRHRQTGAWFYPFQAADLLAWEIGIASKRHAKNTLVELREAYEQLVKIPSDWSTLTKNNFVSLCKRYTTPRRDRLSLA